jgi:hypothetical protein
MFRRMTSRLLIAALLLLAAAPRAWGQSPMLGTASISPAPPNFPSATLGGTQFWTDELVQGEWRIQQNVLTGHYRLLDDSDFRRAWGTFDECQTKLDELKTTESLPAVSGRVVITLHGLGRSRDHMQEVGEYLAEHGDFTWINVSYASTRRSLDEHAQSLAHVLSHLSGATEIDFVCHSLGNLVVRRYLGEAARPEPRWQTDPRIRRMVMLGPPNNGAHLAQLFAENQLFAVVCGPSGKQLACTWEEAQKLLGVPKEFAIIAGGLGDARGLNPLIPGDDDLVLTVEETKLPGASDFRVVPVKHGSMVRDPRVHELVLSFLEHGCFTTESDRKRILAEQPAEARNAGR